MALNRDGTKTKKTVTISREIFSHFCAVAHCYVAQMMIYLKAAGRQASKKERALNNFIILSIFFGAGGRRGLKKCVFM